MLNDFLWVEKYRPHKLDDVILPAETKKIFKQFVDQGNIPNLLLTGTAGVGKTTVAKAMLDELGADYIVVNGSLSGNIDTLRTDIMNFATTVSFSEGRKYVILDEADYLNPQSTQPALRGFIEEFSSNCRFILTCNFKNRIIEPLHSRCGVYEFNTTKKEMQVLCSDFFVRLMSILESEGVAFNKDLIAQLIMKHAPDWRRVINECQRFSIGGQLETTVLDNDENDNYNLLFKSLKEKDFKKMRSWVAQNVDVDVSAIFRHIYDNMYTHVDSAYIPQLVLVLADYQYKNAFVADHELNVVACMTEIMANIEFK